jgi:hypothetical protein
MECSPKIENKCIYCSKTYKIKKNFNAHFATCELLYSKQLMTKDEYTNFTEKIPSQREMYNLLKELAVKCKTLETEVAVLKQNANIKQRKHVLEWLNLNKPNSVPFREWVQSIRVDGDGLTKVFESNLTEGIKYVIKNSLLSDRKPLYAFTRKVDYIYVYHGDEDGDEDEDEKTPLQWMHFTSAHCEKLVQCISKQLLIEFIKWQKDKQLSIPESDMMDDDALYKNTKMLDKDLKYLIKINGSNISLEKRTSEIKKWLYTILQEELGDNIL